ncbi:hypothetical protein DFJ73DRAFT_810465 [Zopfochytrium polystomum]|nr:hypothetical protein DFJ73DRAFT_810465 [Zopfochytrium polystomum]
MPANKLPLPLLLRCYSLGTRATTHALDFAWLCLLPHRFCLGLFQQPAIVSRSTLFQYSVFRQNPKQPSLSGHQPHQNGCENRCIHCPKTEIGTKILIQKNFFVAWQNSIVIPVSCLSFMSDDFCLISPDLCLSVSLSGVQSVRQSVCLPVGLTDCLSESVCLSV